MSETVCEREGNWTRVQEGLEFLATALNIDKEKIILQQDLVEATGG